MIYQYPWLRFWDCRNFIFDEDYALAVGPNSVVSNMHLYNYIQIKIEIIQWDILCVI